MAMAVVLAVQIQAVAAVLAVVVVSLAGPV
jgi:hypothetical protein